ncbi:MAG TPA: YncE family protein [Tepidisphaeraceae bacterium]|nr:YncE family protein [Tepidisphaeraceae bacterium]
MSKAILLLTLLSLPALAGQSNSLMDISADGTLLACSNRDSGTVSIVALPSHKKLREFPAGHKPEGVSFVGSSHKLAVAAYHDDRVLFLDADTGQSLGQVDVADEPYGVVSDAAGAKIYVTLSYPGQIVEIDAAAMKVTRTFDAGPYVRGLAITRDGARLFATEYYTGTVLAIDLATGKLADRWPATASDNLARQITLHPTRPKAYLSHIRSATERAHGEGSIFPYVSIIDTVAPAPPPAKRRKRIPMDSFIGTHVTANPWEVAVSPDGKRFFVIFAGTNDMYACDVLDDDYREIVHRKTEVLGNNPRAVRFSPDGKTLYIYDALDFNVVAYDAATVRKLTLIPVTANPLPADVLQGKRLFYSALQPMASRRWIACSSCHPDGETDGRTWQNPEGLRDTPALGFMAWTHPIHWSADRDEVQDFEYTIRGNLMQGRGLVRGRMNKELGDPNKGLSKDLDALSAYSNTHKLPLSAHAKQGLSDAAKRGKDLFFSAATACATCHAGPFYTDGKPHDVGTGKDDPSEKMPPAYDTPTLLGLYKTAPYLHHGKAATLADVLTTRNVGDRHGKTSQLSPAQVNDLVEFLMALPYEDPEPVAKAMGMKPVER